ncbi:hypothetical protein [Lysinibacillus sp. RC79]|uniref:hypothetical protein n=1 Tax=Lysinibacillus sp. RC79 TaxID=3156296 RepID=UPI0035196067
MKNYRKEQINLMAGKGIKGITIDIGGNTSGLDKALKDVESTASKTQKELREVERASKLDPSSAELYAQKQQLLQKQVQNTSEKLDVLKRAQQQVEQQFANGDIGEEQYRAFQRELVTTEASLKSYQAQMDKTRNEYHALGQATKDMQTFFEATGTSVNTFSDILGQKLTNAIKEGKASSQQLEQALEKMGRAALGSEADIEKMKHALANVNQDGLDKVKKELGQIAKEADKAGDSVNGFGNKLQAVAGALMAGGGLAAMIHEALDVSTLNTNIEISMGVKGGDVEAVRGSINSVVAAIGDEEAAYEGVRRQMTLNKDASQATNDQIIKGAAMISRAYKEIDFKELIQESHEIGKEIGASQKEALALTNQLLSIGFPPEQLDIISEYGGQLHRAGFNAEEIQAIMAAGVETGTWNIDNLLDGLKEGRVRAAEFGEGLNKAQDNAVRGAGLSAKAFEDWGTAIAKGGEDGNAAFREMTQALADVEDDTKRNTLGTEIFGTMWEDQGDNIIDTILNMENHLKSADDMQSKLTEDTKKMESDPAYRLAEAMNKVKQNLAPVLADIAEVVASIADWVAENPKLTATLGAIVAVIGVLGGAFAAFMPAIGSLVGMLGGASAAAGVLGTVMAALTGPIGLAIAAVAAIGVGVYALNEHMSQSALEVEDWRDKVSDGTAKAVGSFMDLEKGATDALTQLKWSGATLTDEMATDLIDKNNQMTEQVLTAMKERHTRQLEEQQVYFEDSSALSAEREAEILAQTKEQHAKQETAVSEGQARINEILKTASDEKRAVTKEEYAEIDKINADLQTNAIKYLSESERDQKVIYETLKRNASELSAQQAADVVKNSNEQKTKTIKDAEETYKQRVAAITKMRDEDKTISKEEADALIKEAERSKNDTIKNATLMHQNVVKEAKGQAKEHVSEVDWETGEVLTKWEKFKGDITKKAGEIKDGFLKSVKEIWTDAKKVWGDIEDVFSKAIDNIKGFFKGLVLKIPKPEMPKMPSFSLETSTKEIFGKSITYPSGIGVTWHAKGGIFDSPTLFPTAGGMHGVGEAGPEAIIPLSPKVLAGIGEGIAKQMNTSQPQVVYVQPAPVYMDGTLVGEITFDTVDRLQFNKTNIAGLSKGVNMK